MKRYAAKLLYGFEVGRKCDQFIEETVIIQAANPNSAFNKIIRIGKAEEQVYINSDGEQVYYKFLGVTDALSLDICNQHVAWYDVLETKPKIMNSMKIIESLN